jgi:hypothetical protein
MSRIKLLTLALVIGSGVAAAPAAATDAVQTGEPVAAQRTAQTLQAEVQEQLRTTTGGRQTAINEVSYEGGNVVMVFPLPGETKIPPVSAAGVGAMADNHGCPEGFSVKWYCFYDGWDWSGRSLQFKDCDSNGYTNIFSKWHFENQTSSWVNTSASASIQVFQGARTLLWTEGGNSSGHAAVNNAADRSICHR